MSEISYVLIYASLFISLFFEVFLLITYIEHRSHMKSEEKMPELGYFPTVTIIIPCYNEEKTLLRTVHSLLNLDYPKDKLKVLIVDDGSTDTTLKVAQTFSSNTQIEVFHKENGGKHTALNFGLTRTQSELVGCLDADSFVDSQALRKMIPHFADQTIMTVTPSIRIHEPKTIIQLIQKVEYSWGILMRKMLSYLGALYVTPGPFSIFRTSVFKTLGEYRHAHNTEDMEMALRMQANHYRIVNAHQAYVYTVGPDSVKKLYKQRLRWTYGFLKNITDYKFLFFRKEYGNIGFFILPVAATSMLSSLFFLGNFVWDTTNSLVTKFIKIQTVGIDWKWKPFTFDWFFMHTNASVFIGIVLFITFLTLLFISRKVTEGKLTFSRELVYYLCLYGLIAPFWLVKAFYNFTFSIKTSWR